MSKIYKAEEITSALRLVSAIDDVVNRKGTDEQPLVFIPKDKKYVEILGHRIDTGEDMASFEDFTNWLVHIKEVDEENKRLKKVIDNYENQRAFFIDYLTELYEEAKLDGQYIDGVKYPTLQERIYKDLLTRMEAKDE